MRLIYKTAIPFVIMIFVIMAAIAYLSRSSLERALILQDFDRIQTVARNALLLETDDVHSEASEAGESGEEAGHDESLPHSEALEVRPRTHLLEASEFIEPESPVSMARFQRYIEEFKDPIVTDVSLFGQEGTVLASSQASKTGMPVKQELLKVFEGRAFYVLSHEGGEEVILSYIPLTFGESTFGAVEVRSRLSHVLTPVREQMNRLSLFLAVIGLLTLLAFYAIERQFILKPIYYLRTQVEHISAGKLDEPIGLASEDELGILAGFFERMRGNIRASLNSEQAKLKASIESLKFGFIIIDTEKRVILSNRSAADILGVDRSRSDFASLEEYFGTAFAVNKNYEKVISRKETVESPAIDTHRKFLKVLMSPVMAEEKIIGAIMVVEDVTEEILLERKKEEFFAVASHELRTPLTSIRGNMAMIKDYYADKVASPEALKMVDQAHQSSIQLLEIVNEFLDAATLEQGKGLGELEKVDLRKVVSEVTGDLSILAMHRGLDIVVVPPATPLPPVMGNERRLREVVYNLVGNALNYTEKGEVRIELVHEGGRVKVIVSDTGVGITPQNQALLFQKFQQAGKSVLSRAISTSSTGMGLYISKLLVEAMHGEIGLLKSSETGSTFFFAIPAAT